jgi:predicted RNA binding protein YcfA (HicA-like mRNA interferase family)
MSKREKRLQKLRQNPNHVDQDTLDRVLTDYGFVKREGKGSHQIYQHSARATPLVVASHGKHVPAYVVKQALAAIDALIDSLDSENREDDEDENAR